MTRYPSPHRASGSPSPLWWSIDIGPVHVIGLNSYGAVTPGMFDGADAPMVAWLKRDFRNMNRNWTPWIVVVFHAPWYNSNHGAPRHRLYRITQHCTALHRTALHHPTPDARAGQFKEAERARLALEPLFYDQGVDLVLNGHVHAYERSYASRGFVPTPCGTTHLVVGDGGNYEGPYGKGWNTPQPPWSAFREGSFGSGQLEVHNATHARWQWRRSACVAPAGVNDANGAMTMSMSTPF